MSNNLPANPKAALETFINDIEKDYHKRYKSLAFKNQLFYFLFQWAVILSAFGTAILAAILNEDQFRGWGAGRIVLVTLPSIGALATSALTQTHVYDRWRLRDEGRRAFKSLINIGKQLYAEAGESAPRCSEIHSYLVQMVNRIENKQSIDFFTKELNNKEDAAKQESGSQGSNEKKTSQK